MNVNTVEGISDHRVITAKFSLNVAKKIKQERRVFIFKRADFDGFKSHLKNTFPAFQESIIKLNVEGTWKTILSLVT